MIGEPTPINAAIISVAMLAFIDIGHPLVARWFVGRRKLVRYFGPVLLPLRQMDAAIGDRNARLRAATVRGHIRPGGWWNLDHERRQKRGQFKD